MTTFLHPDETGIIESRTKRDQDRVACFLHLRDLVYLHPKAASAGAVAFVQTLEAAVIAEKAAREKRLADMRERARLKAAPSQPHEAPMARPWTFPRGTLPR
jgi:hypothetical protein